MKKVKKAVPVKDARGKISEVFFLEDEKDIISKEATFTRSEWDQGVERWQFQAAVKQKIGEGWILIGDEREDLGTGVVYRMFFVRVENAHCKKANIIIEEYIKIWKEKE